MKGKRSISTKKLASVELREKLMMASPLSSYPSHSTLIVGWSREHFEEDDVAAAEDMRGRLAGLPSFLLN